MIKNIIYTITGYELVQGYRRLTITQDSILYENFKTGKRKTYYDNLSKCINISLRNKFYKYSEKFKRRIND